MHLGTVIFIAIFHAVSCIPAGVAFCDPDAMYGTGSWTVEGYGNHRAVVHVPEKNEAVIAHLEWRRRDVRPESKNVIVVDALTGERLKNVVVLGIDNESGDIAFRPETSPGDYYVYYMPYITTGWMYSPSNNYLLPEKTFDEGWAAKNGLATAQTDSESLSKIPRAEFVGFESVSEFDRFDPMELIPTQSEKTEFLKKHQGKAFLLFLEDRKYPVRMTDEIPLRWIENGSSNTFSGEALRGEHYTFQAALYALSSPLENVGYRTAGLKSSGGDVIPSSAITCFNLEGTDWLGRTISKKVSVGKGEVKPLWFGVDIPDDVKPGVYRGVLNIGDDKTETLDIEVEITVSEEGIENHGDNDLWRYSRLRWLNSKIALDDSVFFPYTPVKISKNTVRILGRSLSFGPTGLPAGITSTFSETVCDTDAPSKEILAKPAEFIIETEKGAVSWSRGKPRIAQNGTGAVSWSSVSKGGNFTLACDAKMECDGYVNYKLTVTSRKDISVKDIRLEIPLNYESARYMMGMGFKGGFRPHHYEWKWDIKCANNMVWLGDVNAGIQCKLKHVTDDWSIYNLERTGLYRDWSNDGRGGCTISEQENCVLLSAYTGVKVLKAGEELHFNFGLLITPVKPLDNGHWTTRYYQNPNQQTDPYS